MGDRQHPGLTAREERRATIAYLLDRAEQYKPDSGYQAFVEEIVSNLADGEHIESLEHGEYDDLLDRVSVIMSRGARQP